MKRWTEAPSNIKHANVRARVYVRTKDKRNKAFKCDDFAEKERIIGFQGSL